jgi:DNA-binding NarL/FixJ family response regulator
MPESTAARRAVRSPRPSPIRFVIVAADRLLGEALGALLGRAPGLQLLGTAAGGLDAVAFVDARKPDVVLLDPGLPDMDALDVIALMVRQAPATKILLLIGERDAAWLCRALKAGAKGYVAKKAGALAVTGAIEGLHRGEMWVEPAVVAEALWGTTAVAAPVDGAAEALTTRERQILGLLAGGGTNRHIAQALSISEKTVKTHLHHIFRKLNVTRRLQAVLHAVRLGLQAP